MIRRAAALLCALALLAGLAACAAPQPEPSPTPSPSPTQTPAPTPTPEPTPTPSAEPTPSPSVQASGTPEPAATVTPPSETPQPEPEESPASPAIVARKLSASVPASDPYAGAAAVLPAGTSFCILSEQGNWWKVSSGYGTGWVDHRLCMINLPDVVPSIVYDATNSYASRYTSSGKDIPGITGQALYQGKVYNPRFDEEQFLMPVLYATAKKICTAQQKALAQGNSLKLYEAYRPYAAQRAVVKALTALAEKDPEVKAGITTKPWSMTCFINTGYSNHQKGFAVDVSLVKVFRTETRSTGGRHYRSRGDHPGLHHERPGHRPAGLLPQGGHDPLESEWWHFNDYAARTLAEGRTSTGGFEVTRCRSAAPG